MKGSEIFIDRTSCRGHRVRHAPPPPPTSFRGRFRAVACVTGSARAGDLKIHSGAVLNFVGSFDNHQLAGLQFRSHGDVVSLGCFQRDRANVRLLVRIHNVYVRALRSALDRRCGNDRGVFDDVEQQMHIHELIRKQRVVRIVEYGFEARRAGALVDLIVDREKRSRSRFSSCRRDRRRPL